MYHFFKDPVFFMPVVATGIWMIYFTLTAYGIIELNQSKPIGVTASIMIIGFMVQGIKAYMEGRY